MSNKINISKFNDLVDEKLIRVQKHDSADLLIWNYTQKSQFDKQWTPETLMARGLITDLEGNIKARPFSKFFNYEEHTGEDSKLPPLPLEEFDVFEKLDGSLGILYWIGDTPYIATRGSFTSDQAIEGTKILREKYSHVKWNPNYTYLFEIIYPENRVVVEYGDTRDLFLLAQIHTKSGEEVDHLDYSDVVSVAKRHNFKNIEQIKKLNIDNAEGFVIKFKSGMRIKLKFDEYVRLHRLITGVNAKSIWDLLRHGEKLDELIERVPDEFYQWVIDTKENLQGAYEEIEQSAIKKLASVQILESRKDQALFLSGYPHRGIVFSMLDNKDYSQAIWKMVKPKAEVPFKEDVDGM